MFNIDAAPEFTREVKFKEPDAAGEIEQSFTAKYRALNVDEVNKFDFTKADDVRTFLKTVVVDLKDIVDADDTPQPFSPALLERVMKRPSAHTALFTTYFAAIHEAQLGNSNGRPKRGRSASSPIPGEPTHAGPPPKPKR